MVDPVATAPGTDHITAEQRTQRWRREKVKSDDNLSRNFSGAIRFDERKTK